MNAAAETVFGVLVDLPTDKKPIWVFRAFVAERSTTAARSGGIGRPPGLQAEGRLQAHLQASGCQVDRQTVKDLLAWADLGRDLTHKCRIAFNIPSLTYQDAKAVCTVIDVHARAMTTYRENMTAEDADLLTTARRLEDMFWDLAEHAAGRAERLLTDE